ncbi:uncharacterized protein FFB20_13977 [Fusarium fujikuroi]|nr:uncharacterized protein FFE2_12543 [Fusarium fujikuroi]SCO12272.1 uncharacterized protein FFB20_13977 [Fusarium fujikuroi]SCO22730.1 uncharacterized protein FFC1_14501 [Fusarium fujikuroi]SCO50654.1 uncharacterized protein FFNC_13230 [Fusarium fujikuroi]SCV57086.1 uncharacterized protein FFFS_12553 [Fusarium fujikuroi]
MQIPPELKAVVQTYWSALHAEFTADRSRLEKWRVMQCVLEAASALRSLVAALSNPCRTTLRNRTGIAPVNLPRWAGRGKRIRGFTVGNIKFCASSREENPFCRFFAGQPCLRTHQLNRNDIYHFARNRLEVSGLSYNDRSRLLSTVVRKANGVFLWVVLAVKSLNQAIRSGGANEFEERLAQTPSDLHDLLVDMWNRPGDDAKLSTYGIDASRFFNLALTAIDIDKELWRHRGTYLPLHSMRSLLVMTIAQEDNPFTSILREGREIHAEELQARCARMMP